MEPTKVVLLACGSFNPPTFMHLRMFEVARDYLHRFEKYHVIGGIISPVHDSYGKKDLLPASHRLEMLTLALRSSDWIRVSNWESEQETWQRTINVLQHHQNVLNTVLNKNQNANQNVPWISNEILNCKSVQIKLLCGADLLESFGTPGLWKDTDIERIMRDHGLVVITRQGSNPEKFIYESDLLTRFEPNIAIIAEWIWNDVSSTKVRRALKRQESVRYLIDDGVIDYITKNELYGYKRKPNKYKSNHLPIPPSTLNLGSPSPTDIPMLSATPEKDIQLTLTPLSKEPQSSENVQVHQKKVSTSPKLVTAHVTDVPEPQKIPANQRRAARLSDPTRSRSVFKRSNSEQNDIVKIEFTKDGVRVISDKESIV